LANYGIDSNRILDRVLVTTLVTNPAIVIGQRIARLWSIAKGALAVIGDDPNAGLAGGSLVQYVNRKLTPNEIAALESNLVACALRDEEVLSVDVAVTFTRDGSLTVNASGLSAAGPFALTGTVNSITAEAIFNFLPSR
jgi:hypothetical protein